MLKHIMIVFLVVVAIGCNDMSKKVVIPVIDTETTMDSETVVTEEPNLDNFDKPYVPPEPIEPVIPEDFEFLVQRVKVSYIGRIVRDDPKRSGISHISLVEPMSYYYVNEEDGSIENANTKSSFSILLAINAPALEEYSYLPFFDLNGNATLMENDELEIVQVLFGKKRASITIPPGIRFISNITRPEVDYSAFWVTE